MTLRFSKQTIPSGNRRVWVWTGGRRHSGVYSIPGNFTLTQEIMDRVKSVDFTSRVNIYALPMMGQPYCDHKQSEINCELINIPSKAFANCGESQTVFCVEKLFITVFRIK